MDYTNSQKGIQKIFIGEILTLVSVLISVIATILMFITGRSLNTAASSAAAGMSSGGLFFLSTALALAAFILTILGISSASKDENNFKNALAALFVGIIANIAQSAVSGKGALVAGLFVVVETFCQFLVTYYIVSGTLNLARSIHDREVQALGLDTLKLILLFYVVILVLNIISVALSAGTLSAAGVITSLLAMIASLAVGIVYLRLLNKARGMF
ncbi:MAG: hypothetical protein IJG17_03455 [Eubacterium sp.]|nr:hypothetical protein [Eubacterium sp.]